MAMVYENLSQKTLVAESAEQIDKLCNEFKENNTIRFTQSNPVYDFHKKKVIFVNTLFYLPGAGNEPKLAELTPKTVKQETPTESLRKLPKKIIPESEAKWESCKVCNGRWKWTHYRLCPNRHGLEGLPAGLHEAYKEIWNGDGDGEQKTDTVNQKMESEL